MDTKSPFSNIPNQLDQIPEDVPVVFISYSWDSENHKQWVLDLSNDLREKYRVYTLLDRYNHGGDDLPTFMMKGLKRADRVLIIGTPKYKEKLENSNSGGAKFEDQVITISLYNDMGSDKFVPVLREGNFSESFNTLIETRLGYDMTNDVQYEVRLQELAADLWRQPMNIAPPLGPKPNFTPASQILQPLKASTPEDFATIVKSYLLDPTKRIVLTEFVEDEIDIAFQKIMEYASYNHTTTPQTFNKYRSIHQDAIAKLAVAMLPIVRYGTLEQQKLLVDAMIKLSTKPFKNGEITNTNTVYNHLLASTFLFHSTGVAAVKYSRFDLIKLMMDAKVPAPNALSPSYPFTLQHMAGYTHWDYDLLNQYLNSTWIYPYSQMVMSAIKTYFNKTFIDSNDFENCFCVWEHIASLLCEFHKNHLIPKSVWFPIGTFVSKRISMFRHEEDFYTDFFKKASQLKDDWEPLKQGLFDGQYEIFEKIYKEGEMYYNKNRYY